MNAIERRVKIEMLKKGVKQIDIIKSYGFDKGDLSKVIAGKRKTKKIRQAVALMLEAQVDELFVVVEQEPVQ